MNANLTGVNLELLNSTVELSQTLVGAEIWLFIAILADEARAVFL